MTTYAIGDLQGCLSPLQRLLDKLNFDPAADHLWFVGDLVNRGPQSLKALRYVKALGDSATTVLGNHDLHLLALMHGVRKLSAKDTLSPILKAKDRDELHNWLCHLPLLHHDSKLGYTLVHAGIHPYWNLPLAQQLANEVQAVLRSKKLDDFLHRMYGDKPARWSRRLGKHRRRRLVINVFTRMRYCTTSGELDFSYNGAPKHAPEHLRPWYAVPRHSPSQLRIIFGHWSSHPSIAQPNVIPLDRGCVWGGALTAFALETGKTTTISCDR